MTLTRVKFRKESTDTLFKKVSFREEAEDQKGLFREIVEIARVDEHTSVVQDLQSPFFF